MFNITAPMSGSLIPGALKGMTWVLGLFVLMRWISLLKRMSHSKGTLATLASKLRCAKSGLQMRFSSSLPWSALLSITACTQLAIIFHIVAIDCGSHRVWPKSFVDSNWSQIIPLLLYITKYDCLSTIGYICYRLSLTQQSSLMTVVKHNDIVSTREWKTCCIDKTSLDANPTLGLTYKSFLCSHSEIASLQFWPLQVRYHNLMQYKIAERELRYFRRGDPLWLGAANPLNYI